MRWFRMYSEFATDPKVQMMSEAHQRRLVMLFCLQSSGELEGLDDEEIAFAMRLDIETLHETFHVFHQRGFLDEKNRLRNWDKRQFKSDTSTERVRKYREKSKENDDETLQKRSKTVTVTPPDTDTDTDTEKIYISAFEDFWKQYPKRKGSNPKEAAKGKFLAACKNKTPPEEIISAAKLYAVSVKKDGTEGTSYVAQAVTWLNQKRWKDEYEANHEKKGYAGM